MTNDYARPTLGQSTLEANPVRAPFGYYGAKLKIAKKIVSILPPHNAWVEVFCGSAALTLAKPPAPIEVINDRDGQIVNLFTQLRNNTGALCRAVALTPYSRDELKVARAGTPCSDPLERARRFLVATMMTVNATIASRRCGFSYSQSYAREGKEARVNRWYKLPDRLQQVVERLRGIRVENRDACDLVRMFLDRPATLMYLDPPYCTDREHGYVIDARDHGFHSRLLALCQRARCMILISGYHNDLYHSLLTPENGWRKRTIKTQTRDTTGRVHSRTEVLWMNARFLKARKCGRIPIRLSKKEKKNHKINPSRTR